MLSFLAKHQEPWPVSYLGRRFWENPIGRLYGVSATWSAYLVDPEGKFAGEYSDLDRLSEELSRMLPGSASLPPPPSGLR
jgi:hypothetical protein